MDALEALPQGFSVNRKPDAASVLPPGFEMADRTTTDFDRLDLPEIRPFFMNRQAEINQEIQTFPQGSEQRNNLAGESKNIHNILKMTGLRRDDTKAADFIIENFPNSKVFVTDEGRPLITMTDPKTLKENQFFLNKPGFSERDFENLAAEEMIQLPLIFLGGVGGKAVMGTAGKVMGAGAGAASGSVARDVLADVSVDKLNAALSGTFVAGFEAVAPALANFVARTLGNTRMYKPGSGFTKEGEKVLKTAGIDPESVTPELAKTFDEFASQTPDKLAALKKAEANTLPESVPLSEGQLTRNPIKAGLEDAALKGGAGEEAFAAASSFAEVQDAALKGNVDAMRELIRRTAPKTELPQQAVEATQNALANQANVLKQRINNAYQIADSKGASVLPEGLKQARNHIAANLRTFNPDRAGNVINQVNRLVTIQDELAKGNARISSVNVKAVENWRSQLSSLTQSSDPVERAAAGTALKGFDDFMDNMLDAALVRGDTEALQAFKNARSLRRDFGKKFQSNKIVEKLIKQEDGTLALTPSEATNVLFEVNTLGAKNGSVKAVQHIKKLVGPDSKEWAQLKEAAFLKLLTTQGKGNVRGVDLSRPFSGDKFATAVDGAMQKSPELVKEFFTPKEWQLIQQFKRVALTVTNKPSGAVNTSNTTHALVRILDQMGFAGRQARSFIDNAFSGVNKSRASTDVVNQINKPQLPKVTAPLPAGLPGGILGIPPAMEMSNENSREQLVNALMQR